MSDVELEFSACMLAPLGSGFGNAAATDSPILQGSLFELVPSM